MRTVIEILAVVFEVKSSTLSNKDNRRTIPQWDSMADIHLILELEENFDVEIKPGEFSELKSIADIENYIQQLIK